MSKENEKAIPTLEEYIAEQIATKRATALNKSRTRNLPAYPLKNEIMTEQEWNDNLVKRELSTRNSMLPQSIKALNIVGIDSERRAGYANYVGSNCIGPTCAKTVSDNYGIDFIGSQLFRDNHANYGFKKVDNKSVKPGDIVIDVENGKGSHTMMLDSNGKEGLRFNHSNGGFGPENIRKGARYPFKGLMESYTYTGTPADSALWINQYKQIYGMAKGGVFDTPYLKKGKGIHIKKKNRGKFREYCGGEVTDECILKAKKSKNPKLRKRATFALNSRSWSKKHADGGNIAIEGAKTIGGYLPFVGTALDAYELYKNPSWKQAGWTTLGLLTDIFTGGSARAVIKTARNLKNAKEALSIVRGPITKRIYKDAAVDAIKANTKAKKDVLRDASFNIGQNYVQYITNKYVKNNDNK